MKTYRALLFICASLALSCFTARATPYASGVTNNNGTIQFYLNEPADSLKVIFSDNTTNTFPTEAVSFSVQSGGSGYVSNDVVTVAGGAGTTATLRVTGVSTNGGAITSAELVSDGSYTTAPASPVSVTGGSGSGATFNVTFGVPLGLNSFTLGAETSYTISVYKVGAGAPALITTSPGFTPRGVAVNQRVASPYFGRIYADASGAGGIFALNADMSLAYPAVRSAGVSWANNGLSPYRLFITPDDYLMVGDASAAHAGVYRIDPTISTNEQVFAAIGESEGLASNIFGTIQSKPLILGNPSTGPFTLLQVDGDLPANGNYNSILGYTNMTLAALPWTNSPDILGPEVGVDLNSEPLGDNEYPGLSQGPNGYIYASTYRNNLSNPLIQIYDPSQDFLQVWNSFGGASGDYFLTTSGGHTQGIVDSAVSADGKYIAGLTVDNWFVICPLVNGIPDVANLFLSTPTSYTGNGRGVAFDIADNLYLSSSGIGLVQSWTLGATTTANTTGDTTGATGFSLLFPSTTVSVTATTPAASQGGSDGIAGTPSSGVFTITRNNTNGDYSTPVLVNFSLTGTASNGVYTVSPSGITPAANNRIVLPAGVLSTNITIIPAAGNVPRPETTVVLTILGGASYSTALPISDTVYIQNTSTNELVLTAGAPTMYKAFSNDYASALITRYGDTNVSFTVPASAFTYSGTAIVNTDFTPVGNLTFSPGVVTLAATISPLIDGLPSFDTNNPVYTGNKSVSVQLNAATGIGYETPTNSTTLTIIDNAYPPGPVTIFTDPLTDPADAANWHITYGTADSVDFPANYDVEFGYDLTANNSESANNGLIGLPPSGASNALRITCDKASNPGAEGGVNVYYTNQVFNGNYTVRFAMNLIQGSGLYQVEGCLFGINHNGAESNWWEESGPTVTPPEGPWASDGVWYWVDSCPGGEADDFQEYTGDGPLPNTGWLNVGNQPASAFANVYKDPTVFTTTYFDASGVPANISPFSASAATNDNTWADVEIKQVQNVVTMSIDHTAVFVYTNLTTFTNGFLMLGYNCPIGGVYGNYLGTPEAACYYSDLKVAELSPMIFSQPVSLTVNQGDTANFAAGANYGAAPYTNVWYFGSTMVSSNVVGASPDNASLVIPNATGANAGNYYVVVSDTAGSITSAVVTLTVVVPPGITNAPVNITTNEHVNVSFTVGSSGNFLAYQWSTNGVDLTNSSHIAGATSSTLTINDIQPSDAGTYSIVVTNAAGVSSNAATLTVIIPTSPQFTSFGLSGTNASFVFTSTDIYDTSGSFTLQSATNVAGPYTNVTSSITNSGDTYYITLPQSGPMEFYRLIHK